MKLATCMFLACAALTMAAAPALAQSPTRTRIVYGYPAGDTSDAMIRYIADQLSKELNRPFIVENIAGAGGRLGLKNVINSPGDGGTFLYSPMAPTALAPFTYAKLDYDPFKDLKPVSQIATFDLGLAVGAHIPVKNLAELVAWAKANPGKASYGVPGAGGLPNFFATMFSDAAGIKVEKIPYRGTAPAIVDMVAGHLPMSINPSSQMIEMHKAGKIRLLATSGPQRSPFAPEVPTFKEAGYDIQGEGWYALFAPGTTPDPIVEQISALVRRILSDEETRKKIHSWTFVSTGTTPQRMREIQKEDHDRWGPVIKASGFVPQ